MDFESWFKQHVPAAPEGKYHELLEVWEAATLAERERCAGICEDAIGRITDTPLSDCAKAIRAT